MGYKIGIDLGTTNSAMAVVEDDEPEMIENNEGAETTPSVVHVKEDESPLVGEPALNNAVRYPDEVVQRIKDHMDEGEEYEETIHGEEYRPAQISSYILAKLRDNAEDKLGGEVDGAVITVPYYFGEVARTETRLAAELEDLEVLRLMNEPTAACYAYGYDQDDEEKTVMVYDLGGGTFDATLVDIGPDVIEVIGTEGDHNLGGETFDDELYEYVAEKFVEEGHPDPEENLQLKNDLRQEVRNAKEDLSFNKSRDIVQMTGTDTFELEITREKFNNLTGHLVDQTLGSVDDLFADENVDVSPEDVDDVLLVGGSTRIPLVQERIEEYFGMPPSKEVRPDKAVAQGAALEASLYEESDDQMHLPGDHGPVIIDVLSHSLGLEVYEGSSGEPEFDTLLEKNQEVPASKRRNRYSTLRDNQTEVQVNVLEGEGETPNDDGVEVIGTFTLSGIEPQPAGEPNLGVEFNVTEDGRLTAEAENLDTGDTVEAEIDTVGLTEQEKEEIKEDRIAFKERE